MYIKNHVQFGNRSSVKENITLELAGIQTLATKPTAAPMSSLPLLRNWSDRKYKVLWPPPQCCPYFLKKHAIRNMVTFSDLPP